MNIKGIVKSVSSKIGKKGQAYGVCIGDAWYNSLGNCPVQKGDEVNIDYEDYKQFHNIKLIEIITSKEAAGVSSPIQTDSAPAPLSREDDIHGQVALKCAAWILSNKGTIPTADEVVKYARELEQLWWG